ncbi:MAG: hypothetical protein ACFB22_01155 [Rhodothalassiaceae bacterium]
MAFFRKRPKVLLAGAVAIAAGGLGLQLLQGSAQAELLVLGLAVPLGILVSAIVAGRARIILAGVVVAIAIPCGIVPIESALFGPIEGFPALILLAIAQLVAIGRAVDWSSWHAGATTVDYPLQEEESAKRVGSSAYYAYGRREIFGEEV